MMKFVNRKNVKRDFVKCAALVSIRYGTENLCLRYSTSAGYFHKLA